MPAIRLLGGCQVNGQDDRNTQARMWSGLAEADHKHASGGVDVAAQHGV